MLNISWRRKTRRQLYFIEKQLNVYQKLVMNINRDVS